MLMGKENVGKIMRRLQVVGNIPMHDTGKGFLKKKAKQVVGKRWQEHREWGKLYTGSIKR